jgi:UDP-N-acetylmuramoyl-tripeptide--D-alanyl-D-alanine ligase
MMTHLFEVLPPALRSAYAPDSAALAPLVAKDLRAGDIITVKGSKAIEMPKVIEAIKALGASKQKMAG